MKEPHTISSAPERVVSVDALRGLVIVAMVFVNDLGGAAPSWAKHIQPPDANGMTLADMVFPAFLFLVGMSIPLAFERGKQHGVTRVKQLGHVFSRTVALLLMGIVQFNASADLSLGKLWWGLLSFVAILLAWCVVPKGHGWKRNVLRVLKGVGIVVLVVLFLIYKRDPVPTTIAFYGAVPEWTWLQSGWWGILGLIGWAYLVTSLIYLFAGTRMVNVIGAMVLLLGLYFAGHAGVSFGGIGRYIDIGSVLGSHPSISLAGCLLGMSLLATDGVPAHRKRVQTALAIALGLFIAGAATYPLAGINKIAATPTWGLWSAAVTTVVWAGLYVVMDVYECRRWSGLVRPAGANPLIAYLLHPIVLWCLSLGGLSAIVGYQLAGSPWIVMGGSCVMAFTVCWLTGRLSRCGFRVHL